MNGFLFSSLIEAYFVSILKWTGKSLKISVIPNPYIRSTKNQSIYVYTICYIEILIKEKNVLPLYIKNITINELVIDNR